MKDNQSIVLIYRSGAPKEDCAWVTYGTPAKMLHKFMVQNGVDALLMTMDEYAELPERLVPRDQFGEARADAIFNEFMRTEGASLTPELPEAIAKAEACLKDGKRSLADKAATARELMKIPGLPPELQGRAEYWIAAEKRLTPAMEQTKALMDALPPATKTDMEQYRMTPERKAFGDARVASNVRDWYAAEDKLAGYTDEQVADAYERWKDDNWESPNIDTLEKRIDYRSLLESLNDGEPEPGEHTEVIDALKEC